MALAIGGNKSNHQNSSNGFNRFSFYLYYNKKGELMSVRSYIKVWLHLIWGTQNREKSLVGKELRKNLSNFFHNYSKE